MNTNSIRNYESKYKIAEVSRETRNAMPHIQDFRSVAEVFDTSGNDYEVVKVIANKMATNRPYFLGQKEDLLQVFSMNMKNEKTTRRYVEFEYTLPEKNVYIEILDVLDSTGKKVTMDTKIGLNKTEFSLVVNSNNLTSVNIYLLRDDPYYTFKVQSEGIPAGAGRWRYIFKLVNGAPTDYLKLGSVIYSGAELINAGSPIGEDQLNRGTVDFNMGRAKIRYRISRSRHGFERFVTDEAWEAGTFMTGEKQMGDDHMPDKVAFTECDVKFVMGATAAFDNYLVTANSPMPGTTSYTDFDSHNHIEFGPTFFDAIRAIPAMDYSVRTFDFDYILSDIKRDVSKKYNLSDRQDLIYDIWTGDGGWSVIGPQLQAMDQHGSIEMDYDYDAGNAQGHDTKRRQLQLNKRLITGVYLNSHGLARVNMDSGLLNSGVFTGRKEYKGFNKSSYMIFVFCSSKKEGDSTNNSVHLYTNDALEMFGYDLGLCGPKGLVFNADYSSRVYTRGGVTGNKYKVVKDFCKSLYVDFHGVKLYMPDFN